MALLCLFGRHKLYSIMPGMLGCAECNYRHILGIRATRDEVNDAKKTVREFRDRLTQHKDPDNGAG